VALQLLANLAPGLRRLLGLAPMNAMDILVTLAGAGMPLLVNETAKIRLGRRTAKASSAMKLAAN
jgi:hypothetical protein